VKETCTDSLSATSRSRTESAIRSFPIAMYVAVWAMACTAPLYSSDWPRFRGPNGTGVSADRGLPAEIDRDKNVLWWAKVPPGNSRQSSWAGASS
jgi:hypothetical protein